MVIGVILPRRGMYYIQLPFIITIIYMSEFADYMDIETIDIHSELLDEDFDNVGWEPETIDDSSDDEDVFGYYD